MDGSGGRDPLKRFSQNGEKKTSLIKKVGKHSETKVYDSSMVYSIFKLLELHRINQMTLDIWENASKKKCGQKGLYFIVTDISGIYTYIYSLLYRTRKK